MSRRAVYHVTPASAGWKVKMEGSQRASATAPTKAAAIDRAVELARGAGSLSQVKIHNQDGQISSERTYGRDPRRYAG